MSEPSITFVLAAKNAAWTVANAVHSALNQNYGGEIRLIAVDDGSNDGTRQILEQFKNIELVVVRKSVGRAAARNIAIKHVTTDYIAIQDADDLSSPDRLANSLKVAHSTNAVAVGTQLKWIDPVRGEYSGAGWPTGTSGALDLLRRGRMPIAHPAMLVRTDAVKSVGGYSVKYPVAEDLDLMLKIAEKFPKQAFCSSETADLDYHRPKYASFDYVRESILWTAAVQIDHDPSIRRLSQKNLYLIATGRWLRPRIKHIVGLEN